MARNSPPIAFCRFTPDHFFKNPFRESELLNSGELLGWHKSYRHGCPIVAEASFNTSIVGCPFVRGPNRERPICARIWIFEENVFFFCGNKWVFFAMPCKSIFRSKYISSILSGYFRRRPHRSQNVTIPLWLGGWKKPLHRAGAPAAAAVGKESPDAHSLAGPEIPPSRPEMRLGGENVPLGETGQQ